MEKDARDIMEAKLRSWDMDLQRWRNTVHLAASQLPSIEESYRMFQAKISEGSAGLVSKTAAAGSRGEAVAALVRDDVKLRGVQTVDRRWPRAARGAVVDGDMDRRPAVERFHPYSQAVAGPMLSAKQSILRDMALKEAQQQLEQEGVLPVSELYTGKPLARDLSKECLGEGLERVAAARQLPSRSSIPLGLPCSSSGMPLMSAYKGKGEKDSLGGSDLGAGLVGGWGLGVGVNGQGPPAGRVTDLWCSQFFATDPAQMGKSLCSFRACSWTNLRWMAGAGMTSQAAGASSASAVRCMVTLSFMDLLSCS